MPVLSRSRAQSSGWIVAALLALVFPGLLLAGCDFVDSPERFVDDTVQPPVVAAVDYATVRSGQHLAGTIVFTANLDSLGSRVERVELSWAPSQDLNFYAYLVIREDTWSDAL